AGASAHPPGSCHRSPRRRLGVTLLAAVERIEFELRSLPGVVAAAVTSETVTLLVQPDADADATAVLASAVLAARGLTAHTRVLGGRSSPSIRPGRGRKV